MNAFRCFAAVPLEQAEISALVRAGAAMINADAGWRAEKWVAEQNLHLTLKFFGNLAEGDVEQLLARLGEVVPTFSAFDLPSAGIRAVPRRSKAGMLWASFDDREGECAGLALAIDREAEALGVPAETRSFRPHITLCRARRPRPVAKHALDSASSVLRDSLGSMSVPRVSVFSSRLLPSGPVHRTLATWSLAEHE